MKKEKILQDIEIYEKEYQRLYQFVCIDNFNNTSGCEYLSQMQWLQEKLKFLRNLVIYL